MMVSLFPEKHDDKGLDSDEKFINLKMKEVPIFDGVNGHGDKAFTNVSL